MTTSDRDDGTREMDKPFYMVCFTSTPDGRMDLGFETPEDYDTKSEALNRAKDELRASGSESMVFLVTPVISVTRQPRVTRLPTNNTGVKQEGEPGA